MNYLGLDYGEKHVGLAITSGPLAEPLATIDTSKIVDSIKSLVIKHNIAGIVLGVIEDNPHPALKTLAHDLSVLNVPVYFVDETLTSHDARTALLHTTKTKRKNLEHAISAVLILQAWLDSHPEKI
jgi:putative Holliday junction resolvase